MSLTAVDFDKLVIDTIDTVTAFDKTDGSIMFILDQIKDGTIENGSEIVYGTGKAGVRLSAFDRNKTSKFSCNNGYVVASALASQIGADIAVASESSKFAVPHLEYIEVTDPTKVTLEFKPVGITGKEIPFIYKANSDKTQGEKFAIAAEASETAFKLDPATKGITLPTSKFAKGDIVIVAYDRETTIGKRMTNSGDKFSKNAKIVIDATGCDVCDQNVKYHVIFVYGNAKIDGNFSMAFGNEPMAHAISCEAMQDVCSKDKSLWTWYVA